MPEVETWTCPACGRRFARPNMGHACERHSVQQRLEQATPQARDLYAGLLALAAECGEFFEEATRTAISLKTPRLFMAVTLKKRAINCTIWLPEPVRHRRIRHNYPVSGQYAVHFQVRELDELDAQLKNWLCQAYFYLEAA